MHFLERYAANRYTREDHLRFLDWFDGLPRKEQERLAEEYQRLRSLWEQGEDTGGETESLFLAIEKRLDDIDRAGRELPWQEDPEREDPSVPLVRRFFAGVRRYAAVWLLALMLPAGAFLTYRLLSTEPEKETKGQPAIAADDALPARNRAVLTLSDGSEIVLDESDEGKIAEQEGVLITQNEEGNLRYVPEDGRNPSEVEKALTNTITTPRGGFYQIVLPDGSTVWLNSASSIRYPTVFRGEKREIELLYGEIYLDVVPSRRRGENPFIVLSNMQRIEVFGTEFNVRSYRDEEVVTTTLVHGSIGLSLRGDGEPGGQGAKGSVRRVRLEPGQSAVVARPGGEPARGIRVGKADIEKIVAWKNGYFHFRDTPLSEVMREMGRWYDIEVRYRGNFDKNRFTGYISRHVTLSNVLRIFRESSDLSFSLEGRVLEISPGMGTNR